MLHHLHTRQSDVLNLHVPQVIDGPLKARKTTAAPKTNNGGTENEQEEQEWGGIDENRSEGKTKQKAKRKQKKRKEKRHAAAKATAPQASPENAFALLPDENEDGKGYPGSCVNLLS